MQREVHQGKSRAAKVTTQHTNTQPSVTGRKEKLVLFEVTVAETKKVGNDIVVTEEAFKLMLCKCQGVANAIVGGRWDGALDKARWLVSTLELLSNLDHGGQ